jgi:hypothetical protein
MAQELDNRIRALRAELTRVVREGNDEDGMTTHIDPALARYHMLLAALDSGWKVEPPIYVRSDWNLKRKDARAFHFVLRRDSIRMTTLLSVPDCEAVRRLISDNAWAFGPNDEA